MQNLKDTHLTLHLVRLKCAETWTNQGSGFLFILAKGGRGQFLSASLAQNLTAGDVLVLNTEQAGKIVVDSNELIFWGFSVCIEHLSPLFSIEEMSLLQNMTENFNASKFYRSSSDLAQECHRLVEAAPPQGGVDHRSQVLRVAAAVLSAEFKNVRTNRAGFVRMEDHLTKVFEELSTTELLTLSVGEMARKFSCSRRHLNRLFHQHFGCSVASLRMEMRLMRALSLLKDPSTKIIHVAEQCGFNHLGLFNACFKKRFGNTPGQWRKRSPNGEPSAHVNGAYPAKPKTDASPTSSRKVVAQKAPVPTSGPFRPKLSEAIMHNLSKVSGPMGLPVNSGAKMQSRA